VNRRILTAVASFTVILSMLVVATEPTQALNWSTDTRLTNDPGWDVSPSVTQTSDGRVWVSWTSSRTGNNEIFYKTYDGSLWSGETQLTNDTEKRARAVSPSIMQTSDGRVWVFWSTYNNTIDYDIHFKVFDGVSWSADTALVTGITDDLNPSATQTADGRIWVVWSSLRTGDAEIFYKILNGSTWSSDMPLTIDSNSNDADPSIMQANDGKIWVAYSKTARATQKTGDIYYRTTFDGANWSADIQLTSDPYDDLHPTLTQSVNGRIWVAWDSDRDGPGNESIFYKIFDGTSWTADTRLTIAIEPDQSPSITQTADASIWIVWASWRPSAQYDIYYRTGMELHDVTVLGVSYYASHNTTAFRGETIYVEVGVQNNGEAREPIVEVRCYANLSIISSRTMSLASGQYYSLVFEWNTPPKAKPGKYVISADVAPVLGETNIGDNSLIGDAVEIRIIGDIVGTYGGVVQPIPDKRVTIHDFSIPIIHFGDHCNNQPWPHPVWDPVANVKPDSIIDLDDIMIVGAHFGET